MSTPRRTVYSQTIHKIVDRLGHATNQDIAVQLRGAYPNVSDTTVHRVTLRLVECGMLAEAPSDRFGCKRYDANLQAHDHFVCNNCDGIRDIDIAGSIIPVIESSLGGCRINGRLIVNGSCKSCLDNIREEQ